MSTTIRPELSKNNPYWIEKHRYYELKHFCLQYPYWLKMYNSLIDCSQSRPSLTSNAKTNTINDLVTNNIDERNFYMERMNMLKQAADETDEFLSNYILQGVTEGVSYNYLKTKLEIPCCKDVYYNLYRRFFYLLSKIRM